VFEEFLDFGFDLDPDGGVSGLTDKERKEWRKSVTHAYFKGPVLYLVAYIITVIILAFQRPADLDVFKSASFLIFFGLVLLCSSYFVRKDTLERRQFLLMAYKINLFKQ
jgi:hypothetical protein